MAKTNYSVSDVKIDKAELLAKGYSADDMAKTGVSFLITTILFKDGDNGEYAVCKISGDNLEEGRDFSTGATNIMARFKKAVAQDLLPLQIKKVVKHGNAFDIE